MGKLLSTIAAALVTAVLWGANASALAPTSQNNNFLDLQSLATPKPVLIVKAQEPVKETPKKEEPVKKEAPKPKVITYRVKAGDTLTDIAKKYNVNWKRIWSKNTQLKHQDELRIGQKLVIPAKADEIKSRKLVGASQSDSKAQVVSNTTSTASVPHRASGGPNGYAVGWCTWWVKEKRPDIGGYWGDAGYSWLSTAQANGFETGSVARAGAIGVMAGHVVYVESVSGDTVNISEMGWNYQANSVANYRSVSASTFQYIY